jgi:hypothetical protein
VTEPDGEGPQARWCAAVSATLNGVSERMGLLAVAIADDWRGPRGQEWAERAALLHRELGRVAAEATEIATAITGRAAEDSGPSVPLHAAAGRQRGARLGVVAGERTENDIGMRIARLPEPG